MNLKPFLLERYFAEYEFSTRYLLSSSDCDGLPLQQLLAMANEDELKLWNNLTLGYTESSGHPLLRDKIAGQYQTISADEVSVMSPGEVSFIFMNVVLKKEDHVICIAPAYQSLYEVVRGIGCEISYWKPSSDSPWQYDVDDLGKLFKSNTKLVIINFPHNPTGFISTRAEFDKIVDLARKHNAYIFSDEMYRLLVRKSEYNLPAMCDVYERGLSLWGMAKSFGLAGLRIGWAATHDKELLSAMASYKDYLSICNSATSEILAVIGLRNADALARRNNETIASNTNLFQEFCNDMQLFSFLPPKSGSTAFVQLKKSETALEFSESLLRKAGIMTLPSEKFEYGDRHIRIGLGRKNLLEVLDALKLHIQ